MGEDWSKFMQRVAKLNEEGEDVKKKRDAADRRVLDAQIAVQRHKSESKELSDRLAEIQEEQKALMGSFGSPTVSSSATAPKSAPAHSATSPREDYHPSPSPSGGQQLSSDHIHDVFRRQPHGAPKSRIQSKDNNSIKPKPPNSTVDSSAANEDVPRSPSLDQSSPPTLITTFTTEPNDFWWQLLKASSPIHANFPSVVNMDGKWVEIFCGVCGVNARQTDGVPEIYKGMLGLHNHIKTAHGEIVGKSPVDCVKAFKRRHVSDDDVAAMLKGEEPVVKITNRIWKKTTPSPIAKESTTPGSVRKRARSDMQTPTKSVIPPKKTPRPSMRQQEGALARKIERAKTSHDTEEMKMRRKLLGCPDDDEGLFM